jgi:putative endonuclease
MRSPMQRRGDAAEASVARDLETLGWSVLGRRVRVGRTDIDLIAIDPGPPRMLVFIEVRSRSRRDFGLPEETVDHAKRARLRQAAFRLLNVRGSAAPPSGAGVASALFAAASTLPNLPIRFDLVALEPGGRSRHHRHAG